MKRSDAELYYAWGITFTYNADVTIVISRRGKGKTYGLRKQFVKDFLKDEYRFVEVCRYKDELSDVMNGYFDKLEEKHEYDNYIFKTEKKAAYIAERPKDEKEKPKWKQIGYFVALSQMQRSKKKTYSRVRRIMFDEAILDYQDRYHTYLPNEYSLLANVIDSCTREVPGQTVVKPNVYLLGNACDLMNPYFIRYKIKQEPNFGYSWHDQKTCLLHYVDPGDEADAKLNETVSGRMMRGTPEADVAARNRFSNAGTEFIGSKTSNAKFRFGVKYKNDMFGVWCDMHDGYYYVNDKVPKGAKMPVFALTASDHGVNYIGAKIAIKTLKPFAELYCMGLVRFETVSLREKMVHALSLLGIR